MPRRKIIIDPMDQVLDYVAQGDLGEVAAVLKMAGKILQERRQENVVESSPPIVRKARAPRASTHALMSTGIATDSDK